MTVLDTPRTLAPDEEVTIFQSPTFDQDIQIHVNEPIGSATIAPNGRDVALASKDGLHIIDLDSPYSPPRHLRHETPWTPADVQWSPFASRYYWIVNTSNQRALVWNLELGTRAPIEFVLHAHYRAITDINFSPFHPDVLATCAVDGFVHTWDLRIPHRPASSFSDWFAGATQVKWNRADSHIVASSHDRFLRIWDDRKGAIPLTSIEAHATKIYGVDWSRLDATKVITCALDRTIKIWDHGVSEEHPERIIRTPYPVWRARATPFGSGLLAMPQRGDHRLHLFNSVQDESTPWDAAVEPTYSFKGHNDSVKEFLWRARGAVTENRDERDFQLISWGSDHELILHRMRDRYLTSVGYEKGMHVKRFYPLTRRGSPYRSFRDEPSPTAQSTAQTSSLDGSQIEKFTKVPATAATMTRPSKDADAQHTSTTTVITWIKGVKIGKARTNRRMVSRSSQQLSKIALRPMSREELSEEIIHVSETFKKIIFEQLDVKARHATVSLVAPWGDEQKAVFIEIQITFPSGYPRKAAPLFRLTKSSAISTDLVEQLHEDLHKIGDAHRRHQVGCLEAAFYFLTREKTLKQSIAWLTGDDDDLTAQLAESSSDEETLGALNHARSSELASTNAPLGRATGKIANVPLPKACGGIWAPNGKLICFFPPKAQPQSLFDKVHPGPLLKHSSDVMLEGLGRMPSTGVLSKPHSTASANETPELSDSDDESISSSSSSESDVDVGYSKFSIGPLRGRAWRAAAIRRKKPPTASLDGSQRTSLGHTKVSETPRPKTIVSIQNHDDVLPSKYPLAREYIVFGSPVTVCEHNLRVAQKHGFEDLADMWSLLSFILVKDVPLIVPPGDAGSDVFVLARRAMVSIHKQDVGLDLSFDEPPAVSKPDFLGNLKWAGHPFGNSWLIDQIYSYYDKQADVQMLGLLSCILHDQQTAPAGVDANRLAPLSDEVPGSTVEYYPNASVAIMIEKPTISVSESDTFGQIYPSFSSMPSSDGSREHRDRDIDKYRADLPTPLSSTSTPPLLSRSNTNRSSVNVSLSVSPENKFPAQLSANSSFVGSVWSRPFNLASSPPTRNRSSGEENLATSLPSSTGGVTWGSVTVHGHDSKSLLRRKERDDADDSGNDEPEISTAEVGVKVRRLNTMRFEEEGGADTPLLSGHSYRYAAYRDAYAAALDAWGLFIAATEVRKFNAQLGVELATGENEHNAGTLFDDATSQITMVGDREHTSTAKDKGEGLVVRKCCIVCGLVDDERSKHGRCPKCNTTRKTLACSVCMEPVHGLHKVCFNCGHVAHMACLEAMQEHDDARSAPCETGCGCPCRQFGTIVLEEIPRKSKVPR